MPLAGNRSLEEGALQIAPPMPMNSPLTRLSGLLAIGAGIFFAAVDAQAVDYTWSRPSGAGNWGDGANWTSTGGTFPNGVGDNIIGNNSGAANIGIIDTSYTVGSFTITNGPWSIFNNGSSAGSLTIGTLTANSGTDTTIRSGSNTLALTVGQINVSGALTLGSGSTQALNGFSVGTGVAMTGGTLNLTVNGDYGLGLLSSSGAANSTVNLVNGSGGVTSGARTVTVTGLSSSGAGVTTINGGGSSAPTATTVTLNINNSANYSSNAILANGTNTVLNVTKSSAGTQTLTGSSTYTGVTTINGGILSVSTMADGGTASNIGQASNAASNIVLNGGTLQYTGAAVSIDRRFSIGLSGGTIDGAGSGAINFNNSGAIGLIGSGARTLTLTNSSGSSINILNGAIGDNGGATSVVKNGVASSIWLLSGTSTYTGGTTINGGTLRANKASALGASSGALTINAATFQPTASYTDSRQIRLGSASSTISTGSSVTFEASGDVVDDGSNVGTLNKNGGGTLVLSGSNTYSGGTVVSAGTLLVNNTTGSGVGTGSVTTSGSTTVLGGSGIITLAANNSVTIGSGSVNVTPGLPGNGSTLSIGSANATESLEINTSGTGQLSFGNNSKITLDLWTNTLNGADLLITTGAVNIGSGVALTLLNTGGLTFSSGNQFNLFDWGTTPVGTFSIFVLPTLADGLSWDTSNLYTTGIISVTGVPEPSSAALLGLGVAALALRRRRVSCS